MKFKSLLIGAALLSMCSGAWAAAAPEDSQVTIHLQTDGLPPSALNTSILEAKANWVAQIGSNRMEIIGAKKDQQCVNLTVRVDPGLFGKPGSNSSKSIMFFYKPARDTYTKQAGISIAPELAYAKNSDEPHPVTANPVNETEWVEQSK